MINICGIALCKVESQKLQKTDFSLMLILSSLMTIMRPFSRT